jgi:hypothetical protein
MVVEAKLTACGPALLRPSSSQPIRLTVDELPRSNQRPIASDSLLDAEGY